MKGAWQHFNITKEKFIQRVTILKEVKLDVFFTANISEQENITYLIIPSNILEYSSEQLDKFINYRQWVFQSD